MKSYYILYMAVAMLFVFSACEMKEEIKHKPDLSSEMGRLALDLSVKNNTKASDDAYDFPVTIMNKETGETTKSFNTYTELLEQNPIELPVGTYTVTANSAGEFKAIMDNPYFKGNQDVTIEKNVSSEANVICKMQNVKFALALSSDFTTTFKDYAVTVVNGSTVYDCVESSSAKGNYDPVYFKMENNITQIDLKVVATTFDGVKIEYDVPITKKGSGSSEGGDAFEGGDALNITLKPDSNPNPDDPTPEVPGVGIKVTVAFTFAESEETITIEINGNDATKPDPNPTPDPDPTPGEGDTPTMSCEYFDKPYTVGVDGEALDVLINAPEGIKNLNLKIRSTDDGFTETITGMGISDCDMANLSDALKETLSNPAIGLISKDTEIKGQTKYTFSIGSIVNNMLKYFPGKHDFTVEVIDNKGNLSGAKTISIIVNE